MRLAPLSVSLLLGSFACGERGGSVDAPAPQGEFSHDVDSLPSLPPGTIVAPLSLDLGGALAALERTVPRRFGNITQRLPLPGSKRKSYAFEIARDAFKVNIRGDTVVLGAVIHYKGRAWYDPPIGPDINGECGTSGDSPRAQLVLRAIPKLTSDWKLQVHTRLVRVAPLTDSERDQCEVSFLKVDVTHRVLDAASKVLEKVLPQVDQKIARVDVRTPLNKIWSDLQKPIRLKDSLWLLLDPSAVNLGEMHGSKEAVEAEIGITAAPRIVTGPRPVFRPRELPPLGAVHTDQGFSLLIEGTFDYGVMSSELTSRLAGQSVRAAGGVLEVQRVKVIGVGGGRLALGLDFDGTARGRLWLLGKPNYDAASGLLTVPDLDFDTRSAGMLLQGLAWLKAGAIRDFLRSQARVSAGPVLAMVQGLAVQQLNRTIRPGVQLSASIEHSEPAGILVRSGGLIIRARATGAARLELGPEIFATKNAEH